MRNWRRYEILLPLRFNDGQRVPKALLAQTVQELEDRFGAVSCETQTLFIRPKLNLNHQRTGDFASRSSL